MPTTTVHDLTPRVWVGCLACYNEGVLTGKWVDATDAETITVLDIHDQQINTDAHEELWCFDHENIPITGELSPQEATRWGETLTLVEPHQLAAFHAWIRSGMHTTDEDSKLPVVADFQDRCRGEWESFETYIHDYLEETGVFSEIPERLHSYIDYTRVARDYAHEYTICDAPNGGVYVFTN